MTMATMTTTMTTTTVRTPAYKVRVTSRLPRAARLPDSPEWVSVGDARVRPLGGWIKSEPLLFITAGDSCVSFVFYLGGGPSVGEP